MRHTVFGAGLIGGYLGAALLVNDASVGWVVRDRVRQKLSQEQRAFRDRWKALEFEGSRLVWSF